MRRSRYVLFFLRWKGVISRPNPRFNLLFFSFYIKKTFCLFRLAHRGILGHRLQQAADASTDQIVTLIAVADKLRPEHAQIYTAVQRAGGWDQNGSKLSSTLTFPIPSVVSDSQKSVAKAVVSAKGLGCGGRGYRNSFLTFLLSGQVIPHVCSSEISSRSPVHWALYILSVDTKPPRNRKLKRLHFSGKASRFMN